MPNVEIFAESSPSNVRRVRLSPKTLKLHTGVLHSIFAKISIGHKESILKVELDQKVPMNRCYVPSCTFTYIGSNAVLTVITDLPKIDSLLLVPDAIESIRSTDNWGSETVTLYKELMHGFAVTEQEKICLNHMGRLSVFTISCKPASGLVGSECSLKIESSATKGTSKITPAQVIGFQRVGGLDVVVQDLLRVIKAPLNSPEAYRMYGILPPRGVLLYGPPGTGKTLLASALSEELTSTLVESVRATDLTGFDSDMKIHSFFASTRRKCIERGLTSIVVFIDEIDLLCPGRDSGVNESEKRAVGALLTELDGFERKRSSAYVSAYLPLVVLGATNRPNSLDIALRRPGRFEKEIEIGAPDTDGRLQILKILSLNQFSLVWYPSEYDLRSIASVTHGFVGADLVSLISQSSFKAIETNCELTQDLIVEQLVHIRPSALRELAVSVPKTKWTDIGGYDDVKRQLIESVIWPVIHADAFRRLGVEAPRGILLYGPPGCSKTMMARAVATESSMNFIAVKGPEVFSKWVGESEQAIREIFRKARQSAPCVIFFDEVDAIASSRDGGDGGVGGRVLTQMLTEMDGIFSSKQVIVIAATNRPHVIDPALMRPGRLDRIVYVGLPDEKARESIWRWSLASIPNKLFLKDEYIKRLTTDTNGYSGAEIVALVKEAAILCIRQFLEEQPPTVIVPDIPERSQTESKQFLLWKHVETALSLSKPRTDKKLLAILESFRREPGLLP